MRRGGIDRPVSVRAPGLAVVPGDPGLRAPSRDLDHALERAGDGAFIVGSDGRVVSWNRAAEKILGHSGREVIGKPCCEVFAGRDEHDNRLCHQDCHVMTLVKLGDPVQNFDMQTLTKAGQRVWINISILTLPPSNGHRPVTVHLFRDVTAARDLRDFVHDRLTTSAPPPSTSAMGEMLTRRESEILTLMATGLNTRHAAERLHVSPATVRNHVQNIFTKLDVHSRLEAVAFATRHRWL